MDTEEKKLTSSEIEAMLREAEAVHEPRRTPTNNRNNRRKKRSKIRIDMIIAVIVIVAIIIGAVVLVTKFTGNSTKPNKNVTENPLVEEKYPEISDVVKNYLNAHLIADAEERLSILAQYVDNMGDMNENDISQTKYVESYSNIECYSKEGPYENTYVVYAYYQMELKNISTKAPGIDALYVIRDSKTGNVYIHNGMSDEVQDYIKEVSDDADVQELINDVNKEFNEALESDERLKAFFDRLKENSETTTTASSVEETTTKQETTTKSN